MADKPRKMNGRKRRKITIWKYVWYASELSFIREYEPQKHADKNSYVITVIP
jgi:hypothetical protein